MSRVRASIRRKITKLNMHFHSEPFASRRVQHKQCVALGERNDFTGGLGTFIDNENTKYLRDKTGKLLPPEEQRLFRRLKKNYAQFLRIKNHEAKYRIFNILNKISTYLNLNKNIRNNAVNAMLAVLGIQVASCLTAALVAWTHIIGSAPMYPIVAALIVQTGLVPTLYIFSKKVFDCIKENSS